MLSADLVESDLALVSVEFDSLDLAAGFEADLEVDFGVSLMVLSNLDILKKMQPVSYTNSRADARTSGIEYSCSEIRTYWGRPAAAAPGLPKLFCPMDKVVPKIGLHHIAEVAHFHRIGSGFKFGHHLSTAKTTQITTLGA